MPARFIRDNAPQGSVCFRIEGDAVRPNERFALAERLLRLQEAEIRRRGNSVLEIRFPTRRIKA